MLELKDFPLEMIHALDDGLVLDDHGNNVTLTEGIEYYDNNGCYENPLLCYRLFSTFGGVGFWLDNNNCCVDQHHVQAS